MRYQISIAFDSTKLSSIYKFDTHYLLLQLGDKRIAKIWGHCRFSSNATWRRTGTDEFQTANHDGHHGSFHSKVYFWGVILETNSVPLHVKWQVIWPWKAPVTVRALEWLCTSVFSVVSCKFIRASKSPWAALPGTFIRFLSGVSTPVSLEVRAFGVHFRAPLIIALMGSSSFHIISFA